MTLPLTPKAPVANSQPLPSEGSAHPAPANDNQSVRITTGPETASVAVSGYPRLGGHVTRIFLNIDKVEAYAAKMAAELGVEVERVEPDDAADTGVERADLYARDPSVSRFRLPLNFDFTSEVRTHG